MAAEAAEAAVAAVVVESKYDIVLRLFVERYGVRFKSRGEHIAHAVEEMPLTMHQLRRFFAKNDSPSKAKEQLSELMHFAHEASEREYDMRRVARCAELMRHAAERLLDVLPSVAQADADGWALPRELQEAVKFGEARLAAARKQAHADSHAAATPTAAAGRS